MFVYFVFDISGNQIHTSLKVVSSVGDQCNS